MIVAKVIDLPHDIHGLTTIADDDTYVILLNARDTRERNREAYLHELEHIEGKDWLRQETADVIEKMRCR